MIDFCLNKNQINSTINEIPSAISGQTIPVDIKIIHIIAFQKRTDVGISLKVLNSHLVKKLLQ